MISKVGENVMKQLFDVGKIVNTHGVRGEVRVQRISDFEDRFAIGEKVYIEADHGDFLELEIVSHRVHKQFDLLQFKDFDSLNEIEPFKGKMLQITEEQLAPLKENEFYHHEIVGCDVYTVSDDMIGVITHILETGANDVWEVQSPEGKEILIPFIKDVVKKVDVKAKKVIIDPMEGLLD